MRPFVVRILAYRNACCTWHVRVNVKRICDGLFTSQRATVPILAHRVRAILFRVSLSSLVARKLVTLVFRIICIPYVWRWLFDLDCQRTWGALFWSSLDKRRRTYLRCPSGDDKKESLKFLKSHIRKMLKLVLVLFTLLNF